MSCFDPRNDPARWADQASLTDIRPWLGQSRICPACGRTHTIMTRMMQEGHDIARHLSGELKQLGLTGRCTVILDKNTRQAAGEALLEGLSPFNPQVVEFDRPDLHADEQALGTLLMALADKPDFLVSCGSGTLTDITRYNAYMTRIPFVAYATAASVDGFASGSTPLLAKGFKTTYPGTSPLGIFYDAAVLAKAPDKMTAAGFGDVLAKVIALIDWRIAYAVEDEAYCPLIAALVDRAVQDCLDLADDLAVDKANLSPVARGQACVKLMETLSLTGIAMQMMGTSRPASGSDHHISHLLEMRDIQQHRQGSLHGDKVGIGTLIGMVLYMRLFGQGAMPAQKPAMSPVVWEKEVRRVYGPLADQALAMNTPYPPTGELWDFQKGQIEKSMEYFGYDYVKRFETLLPFARDRIEAMGGPVRPDQLGYTVQDTYDAIAFGKEVRPKFTTLRLAERFGRLYELADEISQGLPTGKIY